MMCQGSRSDAASLIRGFYSRGIIPTIRDMDGMAVSSSEQIRTFVRGIGARQVRFASGIILFAYLISHFLNHALGNVSMEALATGIYWHMQFWQFPPVAWLFYSACIVHTSASTRSTSAASSAGRRWSS